MIDLSGKSVDDIARHPQVQAAIRRLDRLRDAERAVSELQSKLMLAEYELERIRQEIERAQR